MTIVLKPAGVLLVLGGIATLGALAIIRPVQSDIATTTETTPIKGFTSKKKRAATFNTKSEMEPVDLTQDGKLDWVCWAVDGSHPTVRRATGTKHISDLMLLDGNKPKQIDGKQGPTRAFKWSDGDSAAPKPVAYPGYHIPDGGFTFTVDVDTAPHALTVYVGGFQAGGDLKATLTDGTKLTPKNAELALGEGYYSRAYTLDFKAATPGQKLTVTWQKARGNGNVSIQAAALK